MIRECYSDKYNSGNLDRQSPKLWVEILDAETEERFHDYDLCLEYVSIKGDATRSQYTEWTRN